MLIGLVIACIVSVAMAAGAVYYYVAFKASQTEAHHLQSELADRTEAIEKYLDEVESRSKQIDVLRVDLNEARKDLDVAKEKERGLREQFDLAQKAARDTFQTVAADVLKQSSEQFLQLAKKTFEGEQKDATLQLEQRKQAIEQLVKPVRETLDKHAKAVGEIEKQREGAYQGIKQQLLSMVEVQQQLRGETANLVKALRKPDVRGRWGEMQLRRVAELAGMIDHCDFTEQHSTSDSDGRQLRPDMVVHLPSGRNIVVDSKTPIDAYLDALETNDTAEQQQHLSRHVKHIEKHIGDLSGKNYQNQFDRVPDFVVLFIPGEAFLEAALRHKPDLFESAFNRNVILATPSTLIGLLKAVHVGWREEQVAENAKLIRQLGEELHERIAVATEHVDKLGKALESAVKSYNRFVGSYESRIVSSARRFKELGADSRKELPAEGEIKQVETATREIKQIEG